MDRSGMVEAEPDMVDGLVPQTWGYRSGLVSGALLEDAPARASFERAERLNAGQRAIEEGFIPVPGAEVTVIWQPISDIEIELMARIDRDPDGTVIEDGWVGKPAAEVEAEEERRRRNLRGSAVMRVEFKVWAKPEQPELRSMGRDMHAVLAEQGAQVLADKESSVLVCGGALRRHKFPPRDALWLRDGAIDAATCQDCGQTVTRDELLNRQFREDQAGTCPTCGDALEPPPPGTGRLSAWCLTCRAAGRE